MSDLDGPLSDDDKAIAKYFGFEENLVKAARAGGCTTYQQVYDYVRHRKGIGAVSKPKTEESDR